MPRKEISWISLVEVDKTGERKRSGRADHDTARGRGRSIVVASTEHPGSSPVNLWSNTALVVWLQATNGDGNQCRIGR